MARLIFPPSMNIQAPPNLQSRRAAPAGRSRHQRLGRRLAGDAGPCQSGSAVAAPRRAGTRDQRRRQGAARAAGDLSGLCGRPSHLGRSGLCTPGCCTASTPTAGRGPTIGRRVRSTPLPVEAQHFAARRSGAPAIVPDSLAKIIDRAGAGRTLTEGEIVRLFQARGDEFAAVCAAADALRRDTCGDTVSYVVTRNINYTNICSFKCQFCAFSKGKMSENLRGRPYNLPLDEIAARARRGVAARRHRSLHAGRYPPGFHRPHLSGDLPCGP